MANRTLKNNLTLKRIISKKAKDKAWITTGVGAVTIVSTLVSDNNRVLEGVPIAEEGESLTITGCYVIGGAFLATGVVLFVASGKNKKKATQPQYSWISKRRPSFRNLLCEIILIPRLDSGLACNKSGVAGAQG